jgi:hypothetical protein
LVARAFTAEPIRRVSVMRIAAAGPLLRQMRARTLEMPARPSRTAVRFTLTLVIEIVGGRLCRAPAVGTRDMRTTAIPRRTNDLTAPERTHSSAGRQVAQAWW